MSARIKETVRRGVWLYDETVRAQVRIVRCNYFDDPKIIDEEPTPDYPPTDSLGCFYAIEYDLPAAGRGGSGRVYGSLDEAVRGAEKIIRGSIVWDDSVSN